MFLHIILILIVTISNVTAEYGDEIKSDQEMLSNYKRAVTLEENEFLEKSLEISKGRSFDVGNLSTAITSLVNSTFIFKAILIYWFHLLFQSVGWYLTSLVWNIGRGGAVDLDPDFGGAINSGLLDSDFAATNLALGGGQFVFYFLFWSAVVAYGNINSLGRSSSKSYQEDTSLLSTLWSNEHPSQSRTDLQLDNNQLGAALDDLFSPATVTKQFVINILGAIGGTIFISLMSFLPEVSRFRKKRDISQVNRDISQVNDFNIKIEHFLDNWS